MEAYCSKDCQKKLWPIHKRHCQSQSFSAVPVHEVVSYNPADDNYFKKANHSDEGSRLNIHIHVEHGVYAAFDTIKLVMMRQYMMYRIRSSVFGTAKLSKTIIMLRPDKGVADFILEDVISGPLNDIFQGKWKDEQHMLRQIHQDTTAEERQEILMEWSKISSKIRVLLVLSLSELDLIVPDVENLIVLSRDGPVQMGPRWQRMARMQGQHGCYAQFVPEDSMTLIKGAAALGKGCNLWDLDTPEECIRETALKVLRSTQ